MYFVTKFHSFLYLVNLKERLINNSNYLNSQLLELKCTVVVVVVV